MRWREKSMQQVSWVTYLLKNPSKTGSLSAVLLSFKSINRSCNEASQWSNAWKSNFSNRSGEEEGTGASKNPLCDIETIGIPISQPLHQVTLTLLLPTCPWVSLAGAATSTIFAATKVCLPRQNHVCCDKTFAATNICPVKHVFVTTSILLSWQRMFFLRQTRVCHKSKLVMTYICHDKSSVTTKICLSQQNFCCNKHTFVVTKMILVAALANDT